MTINLFACPGAGSILAGRRVGYAQLTLMIMGAIPAIGYFCWLIFQAIVLIARNASSADEFVEAYKGHMWIAFSSLGVCLIAWVWSLVTSLSLLKEAKQQQPTAPPLIKDQSLPPPTSPGTSAIPPSEET